MDLFHLFTHNKHILYETYCISISLSEMATRTFMYFIGAIVKIRKDYFRKVLAASIINNILQSQEGGKPEETVLEKCWLAFEK